MLLFPHLYINKRKDPGKLRNLVKVPQLITSSMKKNPQHLTQILWPFHSITQWLYSLHFKWKPLRQCISFEMTIGYVVKTMTYYPIWMLSHVQLFDPRDCSPWTTKAPPSMDFSGKNTGAGCHFLLQGIFLTKGLNPCLLTFYQGIHKNLTA